MRTASRRNRAGVAVLMLWLQLVGGLPAGPRVAAAQGTAGSASLKEGQALYEQSRFDEAISLLRNLVESGQLTGGDLQKAREFLARSYVKKGFPAEAREQFKAILRQNAAYRPDPLRMPPDETVVFDLALKEYGAGQVAPPQTPTSEPSATSSGTSTTTNGEKPWWKKWWVWAVGAALVGGVAVAAGGGGSDGPPPVPELAGFPNPPPP